LPSLTAPPELTRYLTVAQIALSCVCSTRTVRNWAKRHLLPAPVPIGGRLFPAAKVREAMAKLREVPHV
jgi:hypothetical protein